MATEVSQYRNLPRVIERSDSIPLDTVLQSLHESEERARICNMHTTNLNTLLCINQFKTLDIPEDGNCLFQAVASYYKNMSHPQLRNICCKHLARNKQKYLNFVAENTRHFDELVKDASRKGSWKAELANLFPLVIANVLRKNIVIFSSDLKRQVINIKPSMPGQGEDKLERTNFGTYEQDILSLAYRASPGTEHYMPVVTY